MAWRPSEYLIEGELDNTTLGKVTGWMRFAGLRGKMTFDLRGNFHRDIRGAKIRLRGNGSPENPAAASYIDGIALHQAGNVGDITAGLPPQGYSDYPYIEWYGDDNGRVLIELWPEQVEVIGQPIPASMSEPISRNEQARNMTEFLGQISGATGVPAFAVCPKQVIVPANNGTGRRRNNNGRTRARSSVACLVPRPACSQIQTQTPYSNGGVL